MTVTLKPDLEEELAARAKAEGLTTEEFVNRELERLIVNSNSHANLTPAERVRLWHEWLDSHDHIKAPPLSDAAVSREGIYHEREDNQLWRWLTDTNILLRSVQVMHPRYSDVSRAVDLLFDRGDDLCVTSQNLIEFWL